MQRILITLILFCMLLIPTQAGKKLPEQYPIDSISNLLQEMTPEEKVGQLFLVTFEGNAPQPDDPIIDLIVNHHISGVIFKNKNNNFSESPETLNEAKALISLLQDAEYQASQLDDEANAEDDQSILPIYIPLFITISQESGVPQFSEILSGFTELPSEMAIGATWNIEMAREVGKILGKELEALGFNLLLGPPLDVLEEPRLIGPGDLGVRSFGGDPYWASVMGRAYVAGLHEGSHSRLGVIVKHFPGLGSADRPIEEEVATVRKSLEQLKQIELAPFFAVTWTNPGEAEDVADGLLASHIRYQGFQGNIRDTTRPVSLDPQTHAQLMALEPLATWRQGGGIMVSDSLGSRAIRRFRDPLERTFQAHLVARDAFLAGNDLLILSDFRSTDDPDEVTTIRSTLAFFAQKYREDSAFAQRVDEAVQRILQIKLRLYNDDFSSEEVKPDESGISEVGQGEEVTFQVAREAASLISPSQEEIEERLGGPPQLNERIVFFTDVRMWEQCSTCSPQPGIDTNALMDTVLSLYGQSAAGQVRSWYLSSFTMADLAHFLGKQPPAVPIVPLTLADQLVDPLQHADWLVFCILDSTDQAYGADALKLLLDQRMDLARNKRVVVFAFDVPYGLDATDISKVDVYYTLYSQGHAFIDVAAHLLFNELSASGAPPVSVPGIGYDLIEATSPDPDQIISLAAYVDDEEITSEDYPPELMVGYLMPVGTGVILDANANPVPDGTVVEFILTHQGENISPVTIKSTTKDGVARFSLQLDRPGLLTISARSDPARNSETLQFNVQEDLLAIATPISPTIEPTVTLQPTTTTSLPTPTTVVGLGTISQEETPVDMGAIDLLLGMLGVAIVAGVGYMSADRRNAPLSSRVRNTLLPIICGLVGYNYLALNLPGSSVLLQSIGALAGMAFALTAGVVGLWIAQYIYRGK